MRVLGVHETVLYAADVGAAAAFYAEVLGLEPFPEALGAAGRGLRLPGGAVLLIFDPELSTRRGRGVPTHGAVGPCHVCFAIPQESYESWLARLAAKGVEIDQEITWPGPEGSPARSIYFRDPDRNSVELMAGDYWEHVAATRPGG